MNVALLIGVVITILILWLGPKLQVSSLRKVALQPTERFTLENEARKTIAEILGGAAIIIGLYFTWGTLSVSQQALTISQEDQITDRFAQAIEHLGDQNSLAKRLGGIYELERIARDSPDKDRRQVIEVLTAYVRETTPSTVSEPKPLQQQPADIQAILTILAQRDPSYDKEGQYINLHRTDLRYASLAKAHFKEVRLWESNLEGADLWGANLELGQLHRVNLTESILSHANLHNTFLPGANFTEAVLENTNLEDADLRGANFKGANLKEVNLKGASVENTNFEGVDLSHVVGLTHEQLKRSITNKDTKLPDHLKSSIP
jgi:uncharacterized protein YjbI with pentapeptide repeats